MFQTETDGAIPQQTVQGTTPGLVPNQGPVPAGIKQISGRTNGPDLGFSDAGEAEKERREERWEA